VSTRQRRQRIRGPLRLERRIIAQQPVVALPLAVVALPLAQFSRIVEQRLERQR
jgi:hypothetical protein